jgi:hypothetical protein
VASRSRKLKVPTRQRYLRPLVRKYSSTNRRIAEDRLPCWRVWSILATNADSVACWVCAISFRSSQKASSRLTLVLCPSMTMERLTTEDFIRAPHSPPYLHTLVLELRWGSSIPAWSVARLSLKLRRRFALSICQMRLFVMGNTASAPFRDGRHSKIARLPYSQDQ